MYKNFKCFISILIVLTIVMVGFTCFAVTPSKTINVTVNSVSIKVNNKLAKIDNFSYGGKVFLQPQDLCSLLKIGYTYDLKTKTVNISSQKPVKPVAIVKAKFASIKAGTSKSLKITVNPIVVKVDGKLVKAESFIYENAVFVSAKDIVPPMGKDFLHNAKSKTVTINEKKPTTPEFAPDIMDNTKGKVTITILEWGNAQTKEYKIDNGPWKKYTAPVVMSSNGTIYARGTNIAGIASDVASMKVDNILTLLTKVQVADYKKSVVKVISYNKYMNEIGSGSGFFITEDGNLVTNYHVIDLASYIEVENMNGVKYTVSGVLSYSVEKDLAILKIEDGSSLPYLDIGDSDELVYGEDVVAIGYPLGMPVNVTYGNIGSLNLAGVSTRKDYKDIQISTPISPGNSGGPLLNMYGQVIGINYANSDGNYVQNLNRTIPASDLLPLLEDVEEKSLKDVIAEAYAKGSYDDFAWQVYYDYFIYTQGKYDFELDYIYAFDDEDNVNELNVMLIQTPEYYKTVQEAEKNGNKKDVEDWIVKIAEEFKAKYPNKNIDLSLFYIEYSKAQPNALETYEYSFDKERGEWAIYRYKLSYYKESGDYRFYWN